MRIAHIVWTLSIGGIQSMLVDIVNEQVKTQDVAVFVVNDVYNAELFSIIDKRVLIVKCGRKPGSKNPFLILKMNWILHNYNPDIIHCHEDKLTDLLLNYKTPLVRTIHNTHSSSKEYNRFKRLCCISNAVKSYTTRQGYPDSVIVYNGIHTDLIPMRTAPSANTESKRIVCVGRLHPMKGQTVLIESANELISRRCIKNFTIDFIGDGELRETLEQLSIKYGIQNHIRFLGSKPREWFYPKLKDYDLFVLPSISEGFGLTLAEACAAKIPVLTCDLPGPMEVIANGRYGCVFKTGNPHSLTEEMEKILLNGEDIHKVDDAYLYVKTHFDVTITSQQYVDIYNELISQVK